jgi:hypothetical protein
MKTFIAQYMKLLCSLVNTVMNFRHNKLNQEFVQNYCSFFGLLSSSGILETRKQHVSENGSVSILRCGSGDQSLNQWLRLGLSKGRNWVGVFPTTPEDINRSRFRNVVFSSFYNPERWIKSKNPVILSVIHHRQSPIDSTTNLLTNWGNVSLAERTPLHGHIYYDADETVESLAIVGIQRHRWTLKLWQDIVKSGRNYCHFLNRVKHFHSEETPN